MPQPWDYLIVTASNPAQAQAYEQQLQLRRELGMLAGVRETMVVADLEGKRIGSGGSTLYCLTLVVNRELERRGAGRPDWDLVERILRGLRILIVHAGGDSRRLPSYAPCGKIFVPVPGDSQSALPCTLFDRLVPPFLELPAGASGSGQTIVASGDALVRFDAAALRFDRPGITMVGSYAPVEEAARHGVYCLSGDGGLRLYLQKPTPERQRETGAVTRRGTVLDAGVMSLDGAAAAHLLKAFEVGPDARGQLAFSAAMRATILARGLDIYREICCAMGAEATVPHFLQTARDSGSKWDQSTLAGLFPALRQIPSHVHVLPSCNFLHFGSTRQLVESGLELETWDKLAMPAGTTLSLNNSIGPNGSLSGSESWVEGCRVNAPVSLARRNVIVGVDVDEPLALPADGCLELVEGKDRTGSPVWFVRCYGAGDTFKDPVFCGRPILDWLADVGARPEDVWSGDEAEPRSLWNARVFPAVRGHGDYRRWLWMLTPAAATRAQKEAFRSADRYSAAEIALLADQHAFHRRRAGIRSDRILGALGGMFERESSFSAADLAAAMAHGSKSSWLKEALAVAQGYDRDARSGKVMDSFVFCRVLHSLACALPQAVDPGSPAGSLFDALPAATREWLNAVCLSSKPETTVAAWSNRARSLAFRTINEAILSTAMRAGERPRNALRPDETIWGRGPARIELGGGWTDTPPYTLEYGGHVANAAIDLNGQPPIHCYCRVIAEPLIRLSSIDGGIHLEIRDLAELLDYRRPDDRFALAKAALAISGFSPEAAPLRPGISLAGMLEEFGGGIELTTLVGIPKGSGLGTSSILGAVIMTVIRRMLGLPLNRRELFYDVLRLEQALTTGGGWQDQIGGGTGGTKITATRPGMFPDPEIQYLPSDLVDPAANQGCTLLYYTGLTRLAKNILEQIVGGYLNRDRAIMAALKEEHLVAQCVAEALGAKDAAAFGKAVNDAWELQKRLCGTVTNAGIESLLERVRPHVHGMRISGAGSGGFLFMVAKSPEDAAEVRRKLESQPLNDRSRFFDFSVNQRGIEVTTC